MLAACPPPPPATTQNRRFYFCSDMQPHEAWLFKQWDTRTDKAARVCFHSAVHDPFYDAPGSEKLAGLQGRMKSHTVSQMPTRRSLECRMVMVFPKQQQQQQGGAARSKI